MVVSHYLVSGIQVAGLIVGLLGFFYLSLGLFGQSGVNFLRPLLPALATVLLLGLVVNYLTTSAASLSATYLAVAMGIVFLTVYVIGYVSQPGSKRVGKVWEPVYAIVISVGVSTLAVIISFVVPSPDQANTSLEQYLSFALASIVVSVLTVMLIAVPTAIVRRLSERRLQYIGFTASMLAILTQFIPPVLDLFNVPVR